MTPGHNLSASSLYYFFWVFCELVSNRAALWLLAELIEVEVKVGGMMCDGCSSRVTEALQVCAVDNTSTRTWYCKC